MSTVNKAKDDKVYISSSQLPPKETASQKTGRLINPGIILGVGVSIYAMVRMVQYSRAKQSMKFLQMQRLRIFSSFFAVGSMGYGYYQNNTERCQKDFAEIKRRYGFT